MAAPGDVATADAQPPGPWLLLGVALLSAAAIAYEILLTRLFAVVLWHHFATAIISLALLGVGASGTFVALARPALERRFGAVARAGAALLALAAPGGFALAQRVGFNPLELIWDPRQVARLFAVALLLALPFFAAGTVVGLALARFRGAAGRIYGADMVGAGLGAVLVLAALYVLQPGDALRALSGLGVAAAALFLLDSGRRRAATLALFALALAVPWAWPASWTTPVPSPYKGLSVALTVPGARVIEERSSPLGLLSLVESPQLPFRYAPGLSLTADAEPPSQLGLFIDADAMTAITQVEDGLGDLRYLDWQTMAAPYHLLHGPQVLVVGAGGGADVLQALSHGAVHIDALELDAQAVALVRSHGDFAGHIYDDPKVAVHVAEARAFLAASAGRWDLVHLSLVESFAASAGGLHAAAESPIYTVEALQDYLAHLAPGGILSITRWVQSPPRDIVKLVATAIEVLRRVGVADPGSRLLLVRGWNTATLLVGQAPFGAEALDRIDSFAAQRSFDLDWRGSLPGVAEPLNRLDGPPLREVVAALLGAERQRFIDAYKFNIAPATDDNPYFHRFLKWRAVPELAALRAQGGLALLDIGYLVLVATLAVAVVASLVLVLVPLVLLPRERGRRTVAAWRVAVYFGALGLAFMFLEIAFIQRLTLFLGHPLLAVALALSAFLVFAGIGARASERYGAGGQGGARRPVAGLVALAVGYAVALPWLVPAGMGWPLAARLAVALALIAPLAFLMGFPFPLGIRAVTLRAPRLVPWAWAVNGCSSVLGAILAGLLGMHLGLSAVALLAAGLYLVAGALGLGASRKSGA